MDINDYSHESSGNSTSAEIQPKLKKIQIIHRRDKVFEKEQEKIKGYMQKLIDKKRKQNRNNFLALKRQVAVCS